MSQFSARKIIPLILTFFCVWLFVRFLLPVAFPFLLGTLIALTAEPAVGFLSRHLKLRRGFASFIGVTFCVIFVLGGIVLLAALLFRELGQLAQRLPDLQDTFLQGLSMLQDALVSLAGRTPDGIRPMLTQLVLDLFSGGTALLGQITSRLGTALSGLLGALPNGFLSIGTGLISGFMISARLPVLKQWLCSHLPRKWRDRYLPAFRSLRGSLCLWMKAQLKLSGATLLASTAGFLLLRVPYAPLWAAVTALVDAVPILGTGTVLIPWALVSLLQGDTLRSLGLMAIYGICMLGRSILEPKLIGTHLGLDPLVTLIALYAGFKLWGIGGMIFAPMLAATAMQLSAAPRSSEEPK